MIDLTTMQFSANILTNYVRVRQQKDKRISDRLILFGLCQGTLTELIGSLSSTLVPTYTAFFAT
jgi:hypothetical protein